MSFLPESDRFSDFMSASLEVMQAECPLAQRRLCELLDGMQAHLVVDGEEATLLFGPARIEVLPGAPPELTPVDLPAVIEMCLSRRAILDLVDGVISLQDGIVDGRVGVKGGAADLLLFFEGWLTYLRGAARCPSFPYLLERFRYATQ